jgi:NAD(P)-dependent dehydrogenase (short-subunit alcohol dehydrogenase family)
MKLEGKVAIITGGSKGIGLGCARVFTKYGCKVAIAARGEADGKQAEQELSDAGHEAIFVRCDVTSEADMQALIDTTVERFGQLDCMVNNAGWHPPPLLIDEISVEDFDRLLRTNLTSTFMGCKFALPHLRQTKGNIINMASMVALMGQEAASSYVPTKAGQIGLTRALAVDLGREGVRVNAVCPAGVMTPLAEEFLETKPNREAALKEVGNWHLLGRLATAEEIGEVCAFLASNEASFMTGQAVCPDGGAALEYANKYRDDS